MIREMKQKTGLSYTKLLLLISLGFYAFTLTLTLILSRFLGPYFSCGESYYSDFHRLSGQVTLGAIISSSLFYLAHQIAVWVIMIKAWKSKNKLDGKIKFNIIALAINVLFVFAHFFQTAVWRDSISSFVPLWVVHAGLFISLILFIYLQLNQRGLFLGIKIHSGGKLFFFMEKFHMIFFPWIIVFAFWFHPMEGNWILISVFLLLFLLFIQMGMVNTELHVNRYWLALLEVFIAAHLIIIISQLKKDVWPVFLFGFLIVFIFTQLHAVKMKMWLRITIVSAAVILAAAIYGRLRGFSRLYEILYIPASIYGGTLFLHFLGQLIDRFLGACSKRKF